MMRTRMCMRLALVVAFIFVATAASCGKKNSLSITSEPPRYLPPIPERVATYVPPAAPADYPPAEWTREDGVCTRRFTVWAVTEDYHFDLGVRRFIWLREDEEGSYYHNYPSNGYWVEQVALRVKLRDAVPVSGVRFVIEASGGWRYRGSRFGDFFSRWQRRVRVVRLVGDRFFEVVDIPRETPRQATSGSGDVVTLWFERRVREDVTPKLYDNDDWQEESPYSRELRYRDSGDEHEVRGVPSVPKPSKKTIPAIRH